MTTTALKIYPVTIYAVDFTNIYVTDFHTEYNLNKYLTVIYSKAFLIINIYYI